MITPYITRAGSLPSQVVYFFTKNPDEQLGLSDITEKFDTPRGNIHTLLALALEAHLLCRSRNDDGEYLYSAGPAIGKPAKDAAPQAPAPSTADAPRKTRGPRRGGHSPRYHIDIDALKVEEGIPVSKINGPLEGKWDSLFAKLEKPGQSIELPGQLKGAVASAAFTRNKKNQGRFRCYMTGPDTARVWRIA